MELPLTVDELSDIAPNALYMPPPCCDAMLPLTVLSFTSNEPATF